MRRKKHQQSDFMSNKMDSELGRLEKDIASLYSNVQKEISADFQKFTDTFQKEYDANLVKVAEGKMTQEEFSLWTQRKTVQSDLYKSTIDSISKTLVKADQAAMAVVNGKLPSVVAQSYNFVQALGFSAAKKAGISAGTFQVHNTRSVQALMKRDKNVLKPKVDVAEDTRWNHDKINKAITTSIVKGESIPDVAKRLQGVTNMDRSSAVRNARTAMTSAENLGRSEAADDLKEKGIPVEEVWSATYDNRTRDTHLMLDGTVRDENGVFGADFLAHPLRYPADPEGDPEEIYNCRCRLNIQLKGIDHSNDEELYKQFMQENYSQDWENLQNNQHYQDMQAEKEAALARKEALLDPDPKESNEKPSDFVASRGADVPNEMEAKAAEVQEMSNKEIKDAFVDNPNSYIYEPKYQAMMEERTGLFQKGDDLREERKKLSEELKNESHIKPKSEWTEDEKLYYEIIGDKPMEYTDRGYEIEDRLRDVRSEERDVESKISDLDDALRREDNRNYIKEVSEWEKSIDQYQYDKGDADKDYEGFSTKMGLSYDKDLQAGKGFIAEMSPDEYLDRIAFEIFHTTRERAINCDYSNVKEYAKMMANGVKFDMGYLDYEDGGQEGRHRAMAAKLLGIDKIPVYIRGRRG